MVEACCVDVLIVGSYPVFSLALPFFVPDRLIGEAPLMQGKQFWLIIPHRWDPITINLPVFLFGES